MLMIIPQVCIFALSNASFWLHFVGNSSSVYLMHYDCSLITSMVCSWKTTTSLRVLILIWCNRLVKPISFYVIANDYLAIGHYSTHLSFSLFGTLAVCGELTPHSPLSLKRASFGTIAKIFRRISLYFLEFLI